MRQKVERGGEELKKGDELIEETVEDEERREDVNERGKLFEEMIEDEDMEVSGLWGEMNGVEREMLEEEQNIDKTMNAHFATRQGRKRNKWTKTCCNCV